MLINKIKNIGIRNMNKSLRKHLIDVGVGEASA
jgi:hypothetical protein